MKIQVLGAHNRESQNSKLASLLIDDVLAIDAGSLTSSLTFETQQKIKAVMLTHQHYDHIRDIPAIAMNAFVNETTINIYSTQAVYDAMATHLMNGKLYPQFMAKPPENPTVRFTLMVPNKTRQVEGYGILATPVNHSVPAVGYQVTSPDGKIVFYSGDSGPGLTDCWRYVSPQLLILDVTVSNRYTDFALQSLHLTPGLLEQELNRFQKIKGYLPQVVLVHMNPRLEKEIEAEIAVIAKSLNNPIILASEGMQLHL